MSALRDDEASLGQTASFPSIESESKSLGRLVVCYGGTEAAAKRKRPPHQCEEGNKQYLHGLKSSVTALKIHRCIPMTMQFHNHLMYCQAYIYVCIF